MEENTKKTGAGHRKHIRDQFDKTFKSLQHRNYRLWFFGQMFSLFGTWMQSAAQAFLIFELTHSVVYLGLVGFLAGIPTWLFTLYGGVVSDRLPRKKILIATQISMMVLAFVLAILTFTGLVQPWHILILAFLLGIANAFDSPARQSFVVDMVPREDLTNAIALNSTMFNMSIIIGPALGGIIYALVGPGWCFMLNGLSFIGIIIGLLLMNIIYVPKQVQKTTVLKEIKEGIHYVKNQHTIIGVILAIGITSLFGMAFMTLIPAWAVNVLGGDARLNGLLQSARGIGALIIALWIASQGNLKIKGKLLTIGTFVSPLTIVIFSFIRTPLMACLALFCFGLANMLVTNMCNNLIQNLTTDQFRGRVMSIYSLVFAGCMPIASLWIGYTAGLLGEHTAVLISAGLSLISAIALFKFVPKLRMIE